MVLQPFTTFTLSALGTARLWLFGSSFAAGPRGWWYFELSAFPPSIGSRWGKGEEL